MAYTHAAVLGDRVHQLFAEDPGLPEGIRVVPVAGYPDIAEGWLVDADGACAAPPVVVQPPVVPEAISDRQFFQQLASDKDITQAEALAAVQTGKLPKKISDAIDGLPAEQQFPAKMLLCGATEFHRSHPMVPVLGSALGKDAAALDALWTAAAAL